MICMTIRRISRELISRAARRICDYDNNAVLGYINTAIINIVLILYVHGNYDGRFQAVAEMYHLQIQTIITPKKL